MVNGLSVKIIRIFEEIEKKKRNKKKKKNNNEEAKKLLSSIYGKIKTRKKNEVNF